MESLRTYWSKFLIVVAKICKIDSKYEEILSYRTSKKLPEFYNGAQNVGGYFTMGNNYVGNNNGGIVGGKQNQINNYNSFNFLQQTDLNSLLSEFQFAIEQSDLTDENKKDAKECIDAIKEESEKSNPKTSIIKLAFEGLKKFATSDKLVSLIKKLTPFIEVLIH